MTHKSKITQATSPLFCNCTTYIIIIVIVIIIVTYSIGHLNS